MFNMETTSKYIPEIHYSFHQQLNAIKRRVNKTSPCYTHSRLPSTFYCSLSHHLAHKTNFQLKILDESKGGDGVEAWRIGARSKHFVNHISTHDDSNGISTSTAINIHTNKYGNFSNYCEISHRQEKGIFASSLVPTEKVALMEFFNFNPFFCVKRMRCVSGGKCKFTSWFHEGNASYLLLKIWGFFKYKKKLKTK